MDSETFYGIKKHKGIPVVHDRNLYYPTKKIQENMASINFGRF